jgi:hypothetical protein
MGIQLTNTGWQGDSTGNWTVEDDVVIADNIFVGAEIAVNTLGGDDKISGQEAASVGIFNDGTIDTDAGDDKITGQGGDGGIINKDVIDTGTGDDKISGIGNTYGIFNWLGIIDTGTGDDKIFGQGADVGIDNFSIIDTGAGDDKITGMINEVLFGSGATNKSSIKNSGMIDTGTGDDKITGGGNSTSNFTSNFYGIENSGTVDTGTGDDEITFEGSEIGIINDGVIDTGAGDDKVTGDGGFFGIKNSGVIDTGTGDDKVTGDVITGIFNASDFTGRFDGIDNSGTIDTGAGDDEIFGQGRTAISNSGTIDTGTGNDKIIGNEQEIGIATVGILNSGTIDTDAGDDEIIGNGRIVGIENFGTIDTGTGNDKIRGSSGPDIGGIFNSNEGKIDTGAGDDEIFGGGGIRGLTNDGMVDTGTGDDKIYINTQSGIGLLNSGTINTGTGDDVINVTAGRLAAVDSVFNSGTIDLGDGNDKLLANNEFARLGFEGEGTVFAGAGNDTISGFGTGYFYGGDGQDTLILPSDSCYTVGSEVARGVIFTTFLDTSYNKMSVAEFEVLQAGANVYNFSSLPTRVGIAALPNVPDLSYEIIAGSKVNEVVVRVTAAIGKADNLEFIDRIAISGIPIGVTVDQDSYNPVDETDMITKDFNLALPLGQDSNFGLEITAYSKGICNSDEASATQTVPIEFDFTKNNYAPTFLAQNQSIWDEGDQFTFTDDRFIGINCRFSASSDGLIGYDFRAQVKAGLQSNLTFEAGEIDANLNYELGVDTNYNKTTDILSISSNQMLTGGDFTTNGPQGSYKLDFIFNYDFNAAVNYDIGPFEDTLTRFQANNNFTKNILDLNSNDLANVIKFPPPFNSLSATIAWPNISTDANPTSPPLGEFSASGASNNFLQLNIDVDQALADVFFGGVNPFDIDLILRTRPLDITGKLEIADLDLYGGLNFLQSFVMQSAGLEATLNFEDGEVKPFTFGNDIILTNASLIDDLGNQNGKVDFNLSLDPQATLNNNTNLGFNVGYTLNVLKITGSYDGPGPFNDDFNIGPIFQSKGNLPLGSVDIYDNTFDLNFESQAVNFAA